MRDFAGLPGFTLRELAPADITNFIELGLPTCAFMHGRPDTPPDKMKRDFAGFVRDYAFDGESEVYIVEAPDRTLAAQLWLHTTRNRFNRLDELWIWDITVREDQQRKGIGRKLMEFARFRAETKSCAELWLLVSSKNNRAIGLYESAGLSVAGLLMSAGMNRDHASNRSPVALSSAILQPLKPENVQDLYDLWTAAGLPFRPEGRDRTDRLTLHLSQPMLGGWGIFDGKTLIAAALVSFDRRKGYIERMATRPEHRRAGMAKALVMACRQTLQEAGALVISALIESENSASRQLFESCGFVNEPTLCYYSYRENKNC
jgi:ribosomal protein S18 acetylase RimI-like enzyme